MKLLIVKVLYHTQKFLQVSISHIKIILLCGYSSVRMVPPFYAVRKFNNEAANKGELSFGKLQFFRGT